MKIHNITSSEIKINHSEENKQSKYRKNNTSVSKDVQYSPIYYKDCFIGKNNLQSFKGINIVREPINIEEFINGLKKTEKYSKEEIENIISFINNIIDNDSWEETNENILFEMFTSLALSNNSDIKTMQNITDKIIDLETDDDYIEVNSICKGISAICSNLDYNDYRFQRIFADGYSGFLNCNNYTNVYTLCNQLRDNLLVSNKDKYAKLIEILSKKIKGDDKNLEKVNLEISELIKKHGFRNEELLNGLLLLYKENIPIEDIASELNVRKAVKDVYSYLDIKNKPNENLFEDVFTKPIKELIQRGYSSKNIAQLLSFKNFCNRIMEIEGIEGAVPTIFADFIEDIPEMKYMPDVLSIYTKGSSTFNNVLSDCQGDLTKIPKNKIYETSTGVKYSSAELITNIIELTDILNSQSTKRDMTVYRGEGFDILNQIVLEDGTELGKAIKTAIKNKDNEKIKQLSSSIIGSKIKQERFMSTSYKKGQAKTFIKNNEGILWKIKVPKGSKAIYADPFNIDHGIENEILFNRGYSMIITEANFEDGILAINANLIPYENN